MAAAVASTSIDLTANNSYSIRLGSSLQSTSNTAKRRCIRYNHKPTFSGSSEVRSKVLPGSGSKIASLELSDGAKSWRYAGDTKEEEDLYVLVLGGSDGEEAVLDRVEEVQSFNLIETPEESDVLRVERRYPHIAAEDDDNIGQDATNRDISDQPDPSNPFDYRHYLTAPLRPSKPTTVGRSTPQQNSPQLSSVARPSSSAAPKPQPAKRKAPSSSATPNPSTSTKRPKPPPKPSSSSSQPIPSVRLDRKASLRYAITDPNAVTSSDDDGELIIEQPRGTAKPHKASSMHLALSGAFDAATRSKGPISLHEAMSSREASPAGREGEEDGDVEMLELGSPGKGVDGGLREGDVEVEVEGEDDMERELARAFEEEEAGRAGESEEDVSEEE